MATAREMRRRAARLGEDIADLIATANIIGEQDDWRGARYAGIERDIAKYKAQRQAYIAQAVALETPAA